MKIKRGTRRSLIVEIGRWRFRATPGSFRWDWERNHQYGGWSGVLSTKFLLVTLFQRAPKRAAANS